MVIKFTELDEKTAQAELADEFITIDNSVTTPSIDKVKRKKISQYPGNAIHTFFNNSTIESAPISSSHGWDVNTAVHRRTQSLDIPIPAIIGLHFKYDGDRMFWCSGNNFKQITLPVPWNIDNLIDLQINSTTDIVGPTDLFWTHDGLILFAITTSGGATPIGRVHKYVITDPNDAHDITKIPTSPNQAFILPGGSPDGLFFNPNGLEMFILDKVLKTVQKFSLSKEFDFTTDPVPVAGAFITIPDDTPLGLFFRSDGMRMYVLADKNRLILEYEFHNGWELDEHAVILNKFSYAPQLLDPLLPTTEARGITFKPDGGKLFLTATSDGVLEYELGLNATGKIGVNTDNPVHGLDSRESVSAEASESHPISGQVKVLVANASKVLNDEAQSPPFTRFTKELQVGDRIVLSSDPTKKRKIIKIISDFELDVFDTFTIGTNLRLTESPAALSVFPRRALGVNATANTILIDNDVISELASTFGGTNSGYTINFEIVTLTGGSGSGAEAIIETAGGVIQKISIVAGGKDFTVADVLAIIGSTSTTATIAVTALADGAITGVGVNIAGAGYLENPNIFIGAFGATIPATARTLITSDGVSKIIVTNPGAGYSNAPGSSIDSPTGPLPLAGFLVNDKGDTTIQKRLQEMRIIPPITPAAIITLGEGNYFEISGGLTELNLMTHTDWQAGSKVTLRFQGNVTVKNETGSPTATATQYRLTGLKDFFAKNGDTLTLVFDQTVWQEISRNVLAPSEQITGTTKIISARSATVAHIDLSLNNIPGLPAIQPLDGGITLVNGDRILLKDQARVESLQLTGAGAGYVTTGGGDVTVVIHGTGKGAAAQIGVNGSGNLENLILNLNERGQGYKSPPVISFIDNLAPVPGTGGPTTNGTATSTIKAEENGVYDVGTNPTDPSQWTRVSDANTTDELIKLGVLISEGTVNGKKLFVQHETISTLGAVDNNLTFEEKNLHPVQRLLRYANNDDFDQFMPATGGAPQRVIQGLISTKLPNRPGRYADISVILTAQVEDNDNNTSAWFGLAFDGIVIGGTATATPVIAGTAPFGIIGYTITDPGSGYLSPPDAVVSAPLGPSPIQAHATTSIDGDGKVVAVTPTGASSGYGTGTPTITIDPPKEGGLVMFFQNAQEPMTITISGKTEMLGQVITVVIDRTKTSDFPSDGVKIFTSKISNVRSRMQILESG